MERLIHYVEVVRGNDRHVIELPSEFGGEVAGEFSRLATELLSRPGSSIRIDCRHLKDLTEEGFGVVFTTYARAQRTGGKVWLDVRANPRLRRVLGTAGLGSLGDDDEGLAGTPSLLTPPPTPRSGQDKRELPRTDPGEIGRAHV